VLKDEITDNTVNTIKVDNDSPLNVTGILENEPFSSKLRVAAY